MPSKRRRASSVCNLSRILIPVAAEIEEVAGHLLQDQRLQTLQIEQAKAQGLVDGGEEWPQGIGPLQLEQTTQRAYTPSIRTLLEGSRIALEVWMIAAQQLLLKCRAAVCSRWCGMMPRKCGARVTLADEPRMAADLAAAVIDDDLGGMLVDTHRPSDQALRHRVAVRVNRDVAIEIDDALKDLIDRRQHARQRLKVRLLHYVGRLGRHAEDALRLLVGDLPAPGQCLAVQIVEVDERATREEVPFYPREWSLDPSFSIGMAEMMSPKAEAQRARKGNHLRRDHRLRPRARDYDHAGIVDDTTRAAPVIEADRLEQEVFCFKARKARIVLEEQSTRVGQGESGTLRSRRFAGEQYPVR